MLLKFSVLALLVALTLFCAVSAKDLPPCGEYARDASLGKSTKSGKKGKSSKSSKSSKGKSTKSGKKGKSSKSSKGKGTKSGKKGKSSKGKGKIVAKKPSWLDVPVKLPIAHVIQAKKNDTKIIISKVMKKLTFEAKKEATQVMKKLLFSAEKQTLKLLEEPKKQLKALKNTVYKAILAEIDSSIDKVIEKLQKPCENDGSVSLLGVKISNCKINVQNPTSKDWSVKLSGSVSLLDKFSTETEVSIVSGSTTVVMKFTRDFNIQNLLPFLAGTPIAALTLEDVQLIIASSDKNDFDLSPGLHFVGTIAVDGNNQVFSFIKPFVSFHDRIKAKLSVSGESSLSDLLSSSGRDIALQFGIKELQLGSIIQCSSATVRLANFAPTFSIQAQCGIKVGDGSSGSWKLELEKTKDGKLAISGSLSNTIEKALGLEGFTIDKASIGGVFVGGSVSELKVRARLNFGSTQMDLVGDISQSIYSVTISNVSLGKALEWFKFGHLTGQLPKISLKKVEFLLHLKNKGGPKLRISAETSGSIFDRKYTAMSYLDIQKDRVEIATKLQGSLTAGPITVADPTVKVIVRQDKPDREVSLSGTASFWKLKNLDVNVGIATVNGQTGFAIVFKLGDSFRLSQAIPVIKGTPFDVLEFKKPSVQISSYPIAGIDGTLRKGIVFKASLKFGGGGAMGGLKMLFGSITVPIDLAIGDSLSNIDPKRMSIISAIEFPEKKSGDFIFHSPIGLNLAFAPPAFGVKCEFTLRFPIDKQPLRFRVSMALDPLGAEISGESLTEWRNPFGLKGFTVKKLAIDVGIVYAIFATTGIPSRIGGIGSFILPEVGEVTIATLVDMRKMEMILHAKIDRLTIRAIFGLLKACGLPLPSLKLPEIGLRNAELYVAPNGGKIASVEYDRGFTFMTEFWLFNSMFGKIKIQASPTYGFSAYAKTNKFQIGPLSVSDCLLDMKATTSAQHLYLYGSVSIKVVFELFKKHIEAQVTKDRMYFKIEDLFFVFEAQCNPARPYELTIAGKFKMDFINNIGKALGKGIDAIGKGLDKLESKLGKLKNIRDAMMNKLKSIKIPSSCGNTLAYEGADEAEVMFFRRWRRAFRRVGRAFRRGVSHVRRGASRGFRHVRRGVSRGFRHARRGVSRGFRHARRGVSRGFRHVRRHASRGLRTIKKVTRGVKRLRRTFRRLRGLGRRFGRRFRRFGRRFGRKFGRFARGAGRFAKKAGRTIGKHAKNVGKHAVRIAKKAGHELKKAALKMCNMSLKAVHKAASGVKTAAKAVNKVKDAVKKYAKKYVIGLLKGDLFSLESIRFEANLANVMKSGALRVEVRVKIMGKIKKFGVTIGSVNNVKSIVGGLMKKLIGK